MEWKELQWMKSDGNRDFQIAAGCMSDQCIDHDPTGASLSAFSVQNVFVSWRLEPQEILDDNKRNLLEMTQKVFTAIVESAPK